MILNLRTLPTILLYRSMGEMTISFKHPIHTSNGLPHLSMLNMETLFFRHQDHLMCLQRKMRCCNASKLSPPGGATDVFCSHSRKRWLSSGLRSKTSVLLKPSHVPKSHSRRSSTCSTSRLWRAAIGKAVSYVRRKGLLYTAATGNPDSASASWIACVCPCALNGSSLVPI